MTEALAPKSVERRERLLDAAEACFIESGFHGARMAQIAKAANMSAGHIYHYFDGKEQIIAGLLRRHFNEKLSMVERLQAAENGALELMLEDASESVECETDPFWSTLMLEIVAETTRNSAIAEMMRDADADLKCRVLKCLRNSESATQLEVRLEMLIVMMQGMRIRSISSSDYDKSAMMPLFRSLVQHLFSMELPPVERS